MPSFKLGHPVSPEALRWQVLVCLLLSLDFVHLAAARAADNPSFAITEFEVAGNTRLPAVDVERAVYPFLGESRSIDDARNAAKALQKAYQDAGFLTVLVDVPEQRVEQGVVRLAVTEGKVERLRVTGSRYYSLDDIKAGVPELAAGNTPKFNELQKELADLNRAPDRRVTPAMRPGRVPGAVDVDLKVEDHLPFHGDLQLNNHNSNNTQPLRLSGSLRYDNLWQAQHSLSVQFQTSPQDTHQVRLLTTSYTLPLPHSDDTLAFYAVRSRSNVAAAGDLTVLGDGDIVGVRAILPLEITEQRVESFTLGFDYKSFTDNLRLAGADTGRTPIHYAIAPLQYSLGLQDPAGNLASVAVTGTVGLRGVLGSSDVAFDNKRFSATAGFFDLKVESSVTRKLSQAWSVYGKLDAQSASGPLISNEQYGVGGAESVRGYHESAVLGDDAVHWTGELRAGLPDSWRPAQLQELTVLAFSDGAQVRIKDSLPGQVSRNYITSMGLGLRARASKSLRAAANIAVPLNNAPGTRQGDGHVDFSLGYEF